MTAVILGDYDIYSGIHIGNAAVQYSGFRSAAYSINCYYTRDFAPLRVATVLCFEAFVVFIITTEDLFFCGIWL